MPIREVCIHYHQGEKQSTCGVHDLPSIILTCDTTKYLKQHNYP